MKRFVVISHDRTQNLCGVEKQVFDTSDLDAALRLSQGATREEFDQVEESEGVLAVEDGEGCVITVVEI